ncbi:AraC family transcriptional regulator [Christensenellaceae bacterium OttesenSCG-928-K19]|nr:AraC family transcriptional regulator [Christensenellaceae bacterium OttesenSCG-928-K19]
MKNDHESSKVFEFVKFNEGESIKVFISYPLSMNSTTFHWHHEMEFGLVLNGPIEFYTDDKRYHLKTGDIFFVNSNASHCLQRTKEFNSQLIVQLPPNFCETYFPEMKQTRFLDTVFMQEGEHKPFYDYLFREISGLMQVLYDKGAGYPFKTMSIVNELFYGMLRYTRYEVVDEEKQAKEARNMNRLNRIIRFMQDNYTQKITLSMLAEDEGLDMYYLSHFIKKHLGMSFQQYLNKLRLTKAAELLVHSDKKNIDICIESGFSGYRYFCKALEQEYGCTPSEYKKRYWKERGNSPDLQNINYEGDNNEYTILGLEDTFRGFFEFMYLNRK